MRLTSKGQVTIPQKIREKAGLKPYDEVEFEFENNQIVMRPLRGKRLSVGEEAIALLRGSATANLGMSTDDWMEITRGER
ncbi:MAG: AbrB/MazE/SpoVT family DNA-binding domain-containing protein [Burkholderiales bacterium]